MKKTLLLLIFIIPLTAYPQSKKSVDGFLNIPFGSDSATVKNVFLSKGATENYALTEKDIVVFSYFTFGNRKVFSCIVTFLNNKAYQADFLFNDFAENDALSYYDSLSADIATVYGHGELTENFRRSESNSARLSRIESGDAVCKTLWQSNNNNVVSLELIKYAHSTLHIELTYQDETLLDMARSKVTSDF